MPRENYVQVRLDDGEKAACQSWANKLSLSLAAWIRLVLRERIQTQRRDDAKEGK